MHKHIRAHAKLNWALNILGMRQDGYHEMDMIMQPISLCDDLFFEEAPAGMLLLNGSEDNLVLRAARALHAFAHVDLGASIWLEKHIPARAGLGGGSADAAATLVALNELWELSLPMQTLCEIGRSLGADVPFCLMARPMRVQGLGERLTDIPSIPSLELVILHPGGGLSTPSMFRAWDEERIHMVPADIDASIEALVRCDISALWRSARNMFTDCAAEVLPEIPAALSALRDAGADFAAMSGSGSAVFGAFTDASSADRAAQQLGHAAIRAHTLPCAIPSGGGEGGASRLDPSPPPEGIPA